MSPLLDESVLESPQGIAAADPGGMLRAVASAGAQVRQATRLATEAGVAQVAAEGRPRAVVLIGMGGSGIAAEITAAVAGTRCPVPVLSHHAPWLPGWVGPTDLVIAVSCSGATEEVLLAAREAARRGCRLVTVGAPGSTLAATAEQARGIHLPVDPGGRLPRANVWALSVPPLLVLDALGLAAVPGDALDAAADRLDRLAATLGPASPPSQNPAKALALELAEDLPAVWGSGDVAEASAYRLACQLNENAKLPVTYGALPEIAHNQIVSLDGPFAGTSTEDDFFRDRVDEPGAGARLRILLLRDTAEHPHVTAQRKALVEIALERGTQVHEILAQGEHPLERLGHLVLTGDFLSVYVALLRGTDPTPIGPITQMKGRLAR
ncbi:MAG: mannose-6-phosphate isomerase [Actinomycetota bacterium]|nr:mannose-6-phosphate isomerase [Actinomycetota bacterium]